MYLLFVCVIVLFGCFTSSEAVQLFANDHSGASQADVRQEWLAARDASEVAGAEFAETFERHALGTFQPGAILTGFGRQVLLVYSPTPNRYQPKCNNQPSATVSPVNTIVATDGSVAGNAKRLAIGSTPSGAFEFDFPQRVNSFAFDIKLPHVRQCPADYSAAAQIGPRVSIDLLDGDDNLIERYDISPPQRGGGDRPNDDYFFGFVISECDKDMVAKVRIHTPTLHFDDEGWGGYIDNVQGTFHFPALELAVQGDAAVAAVTAGDTDGVDNVDFTITVENKGPGMAKDVRINVVPETNGEIGWKYTPKDVPASTSFGGNVWKLPALKEGETASMVLNARAGSLSNPDIVRVTASVMQYTHRAAKACGDDEQSCVCDVSASDSRPVLNEPNLHAEIDTSGDVIVGDDDGDLTLATGTSLAWTVTISNPGGSASKPQFTDLQVSLPNGCTIDSLVLALPARGVQRTLTGENGFQPVNGNPQLQFVQRALKFLDADETAVYHIDVTCAPDATDSAALVLDVNARKGSFPDGLPVPGSNPADGQATSTVQVLRLATIVPSLSGIATVVAGAGALESEIDDANFELSIALDNTAVSDSNPVTVTITVDEITKVQNQFLDAVALSDGVTVDSQFAPLRLLWNVPSVAAGDLDTVATLRFRFDACFPHEFELNFVVTVHEAGSDPHADLVHTVTVRREVNYVLSVEDSVDPVLASDDVGNLEHRVRLHNLGPSCMGGAVVSTELLYPRLAVIREGIEEPTVNIDDVTGFGNTVYTIVECPHGTQTDLVNGLCGEWDMVSKKIPPGASRELLVTMSVTKDAVHGADLIRHRASLATVDADVPTPLLPATETTSISGLPDLRVLVESTTNPVLAGAAPNPLQHIVTVENVDNERAAVVTATDVTVTFVLHTPAGVDVVEKFVEQGTVALAATQPASGTAYVWSVGELPRGASERLTISFDVSSAVTACADCIVTGAKVALTGDRRNPDDDSAFVSTSVEHGVTLVLRKTARSTVLEQRQLDPNVRAHKPADENDPRFLRGELDAQVQREDGYRYRDDNDIDFRLRGVDGRHLDAKRFVTETGIVVLLFNRGPSNLDAGVMRFEITLPRTSNVTSVTTEASGVGDTSEFARSGPSSGAKHVIDWNFGIKKDEHALIDIVIHKSQAKRDVDSGHGSKVRVKALLHPASMTATLLNGDNEDIGFGMAI